MEEIKDATKLVQRSVALKAMDRNSSTKRAQTHAVCDRA